MSITFLALYLISIFYAEKKFWTKNYYSHRNSKGYCFFQITGAASCPAAFPFSFNNGQSCCRVPFVPKSCPKSYHVNGQKRRIKFNDPVNCCLEHHQVECPGWICKDGKKMLAIYLSFVFISRVLFCSSEIWSQTLFEVVKVCLEQICLTSLSPFFIAK